VRAAHVPRLDGFAAAGILGGSNHVPTPALLAVVVDMTSQEDTERVFLEFCRGTLSGTPFSEETRWRLACRVPGGLAANGHPFPAAAPADMDSPAGIRGRIERIRNHLPSRN
jgi:hypothetical protein